MRVILVVLLGLGVLLRSLRIEMFFFLCGRGQKGELFGRAVFLSSNLPLIASTYSGPLLNFIDRKSVV